MAKVAKTIELKSDKDYSCVFYEYRDQPAICRSGIEQYFYMPKDLDASIYLTINGCTSANTCRTKITGDRIWFLNEERDEWESEWVPEVFWPMIKRLGFPDGKEFNIGFHWYS